MKCTSCQEPFRERGGTTQNSEGHEIQARVEELPRILVNCGHSMCTKCLEDVLRQNFFQVPQKEQDWEDKLNRLSCKECETPIINEMMLQKLKTEIDLDSFVQLAFPVNLGLLELQKSLQAGKDDNQSSTGNSNSLLQHQQRRAGRTAQRNLSDSLNRRTLGSINGRGVSSEPGQRADDNLENMRDQTSIDILEQINVEFQLHSRRQKILTCISQSSDSETQSPSEVPILSRRDKSFNKAPKKAVSKFCKMHLHKKVEAFCENCKQVLCIDCILKQDHKSHEMVSIEIGSKQEKEFYIQKATNSQLLLPELENQIIQIKNYLSELEQNAKVEREKISMIFNEVRQKIIEREQLLKKRISDMLDSEQILFKQRIQNLKDQIRCIKDVKHERQKIDSEIDLMILQKAKIRYDLQLEANKAIENYELKNTLPEIDREHEIACIVKHILPKKLRPSLLSSTLTSQIRKIQQRENTRKKEIRNNKKEIDVLLNGEGGIKSGPTSSLGIYPEGSSFLPLQAQAPSVPAKHITHSSANIQTHRIVKDKSRHTEERLLSASSLSTRLQNKNKVKRIIEATLQDHQHTDRDGSKRTTTLSPSPNQKPTQPTTRLSPLKEEPEQKKGIAGGQYSSFSNQRVKSNLSTNRQILQRLPTAPLKHSEKERKQALKKLKKKSTHEAKEGVTKALKTQAHDSMSSPKNNLKTSRNMQHQHQPLLANENNNNQDAANRIPNKFESSKSAENQTNLQRQLENLKDVMLDNLATNMSLANVQYQHLGLDKVKNAPGSDQNKKEEAIYSLMAIDKINETIELKKNMSTNFDQEDLSLLLQMNEGQDGIQSIKLGTLKDLKVEDQLTKGELLQKKIQNMNIDLSSAVDKKQNGNEEADFQVEELSDQKQAPKQKSERSVDKWKQQKEASNRLSKQKSTTQIAVEQKQKKSGKGKSSNSQMKQSNQVQNKDKQQQRLVMVTGRPHRKNLGSVLSDHMIEPKDSGTNLLGFGIDQENATDNERTQKNRLNHHKSTSKEARKTWQANQPLNLKSAGKDKPSKIEKPKTAAQSFHSRMISDTKMEKEFQEKKYIKNAKSFAVADCNRAPSPHSPEQIKAMMTSPKDTVKSKRKQWTTRGTQRVQSAMHTSNEQSIFSKEENIELPLQILNSQQQKEQHQLNNNEIISNISEKQEASSCSSPLIKKQRKAQQAGFNGKVAPGNGDTSFYRNEQKLNKIMTPDNKMSLIQRSKDNVTYYDIDEAGLNPIQRGRSFDEFRIYQDVDTVSSKSQSCQKMRTSKDVSSALRNKNKQMQSKEESDLEKSVKNKLESILQKYQKFEIQDYKKSSYSKYQKLLPPDDSLDQTSNEMKSQVMQEYNIQQAVAANINVVKEHQSIQKPSMESILSPKKSRVMQQSPQEDSPLAAGQRSNGLQRKQDGLIKLGKVEVPNDISEHAEGALRQAAGLCNDTLSDGAESNQEKENMQPKQEERHSKKAVAHKLKQSFKNSTNKPRERDSSQDDSCDFQVDENDEIQAKQRERGIDIHQSKIFRSTEYRQNQSNSKGAGEAKQQSNREHRAFEGKSATQIATVPKDEAQATDCNWRLGRV